MTLLKFIPCLALLTAALHAQAPAEPGPLTPDQQPETQAMATAARNLTRTSKASDEAKADAAKLIEESATVQGGETRRKLANAITLLSGGAWDAKVELAWSLGMYRAATRMRMLTNVLYATEFRKLRETLSMHTST